MPPIPPLRRSSKKTVNPAPTTPMTEAAPASTSTAPATASMPATPTVSPSVSRSTSKAKRVLTAPLTMLKPKISTESGMGVVTRDHAAGETGGIKRKSVESLVGKVGEAQRGESVKVEQGDKTTPIPAPAVAVATTESKDEGMGNATTIAATPTTTTTTTNTAITPITADPADPPAKTRPRSSSRRSAHKVASVETTATQETKRASWFGRKGTWPRSSVAKFPPLTDVTKAYASGESQPLKADDSGAESGSEGIRTKTLGGDRESSDCSQTVPEATAPTPAPPPPPDQAEEAEAEATKATKDEGEESAKKVEEVSELAKPAARQSWVEWWYGQQPAEASGAVSGGETDSVDAHAEAPVSGTSGAELANTTGKEQPVELHVSRAPEATSSTSASTATTAATLPPAAVKTELQLTREIMEGDGKKQKEEEEKGKIAATTQTGRGWFGLWGGGEQPAPEPEVQKQNEVPVLSPVQEETPVVAEPVQPEQQPPPQPEPVKGYGYGWAFWSKGTTDSPQVDDTKETIGEVAATNTSTETEPVKAKVKIADDKTLKTSASTPNLTDDSRPSTPNPKKPSAPTKASPLKTSENASTTSLPVPLTAQTSSNASTTSLTSPASTKLQKLIPQNHLLPSFESCYTLPPHPTLLSTVTSYLPALPIPGRRPPPPPAPPKHLYISLKPPTIHRAVAIGVHGFFPMRLVRTVLGEPTGTSIRFANHAAASISRWAAAHNQHIEIEKIALEGEGKVADRVEMLWKLLGNWISHVRSADLVVIAAHSQGVPVGMQLLARMMEEGVIDHAKRVVFLGMAGICLGPFGHLPTAILTGSAKELFEFQKPNSAPSQNFLAALERVVSSPKIRVGFVGSIDDQLVPLESSTMMNVTHPAIFRAVFVDGRVHAPDFLSHLVGFAMKLRNLGVSDHGLVRELSTPLAGSLYGGEGHSRIYDDGCVYDLAIRHALETIYGSSDPSSHPHYHNFTPPKLEVAKFELPSATNSNPYILPWAMRGLLEEEYVKERLGTEGKELVRMFEDWKPSTKGLKDVKVRLEGVRSKL